MPTHQQTLFSVKAMNNKTSIDESATPARQGFYEAELEDGTTLVAEWREHVKGAGRSWHQYVSDDPTAEKKPVPLVGVKSYRSATKEAIALALKRELTVDEQIEAALDSFRVTSGLYKDSVRDVPPPSRRLEIGEELFLGNLLECKVVRLVDEDRIVVLSYRNKDHNYGKPIDHGIAYMARHWTDVTSKRTAATAGRVRETVMFDSFRTTALESLLEKYKQGLNNNPDYQRGYAWSESDQQRYLDSLFSGRELGRFVFVSNQYPTLDDVLDGKQRLNCLWLFYTSQLAYQGVYWHELSRRDRTIIEDRAIQMAELPAKRMTRAQLLRIFLELNAAGVPQTPEHLAHVERLLADEEAKEAKAS